MHYSGVSLVFLSLVTKKSRIEDAYIWITKLKSYFLDVLYENLSS
jgi:hypothetical protein